MSDLDTGKNFTQAESQGSFSGAVKRFVNPTRDPQIMDFDSDENGYDADDDSSDIDNGDDDNGNGAAYGDQTWRRPSYDPGTDGCSVAQHSVFIGQTCTDCTFTMVALLQGTVCFYRPDMQTLALVALLQWLPSCDSGNGCIVQSQPSPTQPMQCLKYTKIQQQYCCNGCTVYSRQCPRIWMEIGGYSSIAQCAVLDKRHRKAKVWGPFDRPIAIYTVYRY